MDNCDLEKLSVSGGKLHPDFSPEVTDYRVTVESSVNKVSLDLLTSDCGASYSIVGIALHVKWCICLPKPVYIYIHIYMNISVLWWWIQHHSTGRWGEQGTGRGGGWGWHREEVPRGRHQAVCKGRSAQWPHCGRRHSTSPCILCQTLWIQQWVYKQTVSESKQVIIELNYLVLSSFHNSNLLHTVYWTRCIFNTCQNILKKMKSAGII